MAITISDIAKQCKVSKGAVSQVLRNPKHPRFAPQTRERILFTAMELSYLPNALAQQLREGQTRMLSLILPYNISDLMDEIERAAEKRGYFIMVQFTPLPEDNMEFNAIKIAVSRKVDGMLWLPAHQSSHYQDAVELLVNNKVPIVLLESGISGLESADVVTYDHPSACRQAIKHLVDCGYRRLVHLTNDESMAVRKRIADDFRSMSLEYNIKGEVLCWRLDRQDEKLANFLDQLKEPVGFYCENETLSVQLTRIAQSKGIDIPARLGIIGIGDPLVGGNYLNLRLGELLRPSLSAVRRPYHEMAMHAVELLVDKLEGKADTSSRTIAIPMPFVARESTCGKKVYAANAEVGKERR